MSQPHDSSYTEIPSAVVGVLLLILTVSSSSSIGKHRLGYLRYIKRGCEYHAHCFPVEGGML